MDEIEAIKRYIERTKIEEGARPYCMKCSEWRALCNLADSSRQNLVDAIDLAFWYGRAKGERHARREAAKKHA